MNQPNADDIACASAACDHLKDCRGLITGSHLARVAQLFADHRAKAEARAKDLEFWVKTYREELCGALAIGGGKPDVMRAMVEALEKMNDLLR